MNGKLISIEGIDGSGKTTVTEKLVKRLRRETGKDIIKTKEPTDTWLGRSVRRGLNTEIDSLAEAFLFTSDHIEHVEKEIKPKLKEGKLIVSDRYSDSFYAYQGTTLAQKKPIKEPVNYLKNLREDFTIKPDLTIFLDVDPEIAVKRLGKYKIKFENISFQKRVYKKFKKIIEAERNRFLVIDGERDIKEIIEEIIDLTVKNLNL